MANVNAEMLRLLDARARVAAASVSPGNGGRFGAVAVKAVRAVRALCVIAASRMRGARVWYGSVDDRFGGMFTCAFAALARFSGMRIFLHHHSFLYVDADSAVMRWLTWLAGPRARHVVLCEAMGERFRARYPAVRHVIAAPNAVPEPEEAAPRAKRGGITIGLMSNLMFEKGLATFTALVEAARAEGLDVRGVLAGPASGPAAERHIGEAVARNSAALEWRGPVAGDAREAFFADIDLFVFPTTYRTEAYPLVLVEALVRAVPVIALERGCICDLAPLESCTVVASPDDFANTALALLRRWQSRPEDVVEASRIARTEGRALNAANLALRDGLVAEIVAAATH